MVEAMIVIAIFGIIAVSFYSAFSLGMNNILDSRNRLRAVSLANEKMEIIRNLQYSSIGVVGGIPSGNIPAEESISNTPFKAKTYIKYFDDPLDNISLADTIPNDCKIVRVEIVWNGFSGQERIVSLISRFAPKGEESNNPNEGVLSFNISDSAENKVSQANIRVVNTGFGINMNDFTDSFGNLVYPGVRESLGTYEITIAKNGYETFKTYSTTAIFEPEETYRNVSVFRGETAEKKWKLDKVANLKITSKDFFGDPVPNVSFKIEGGRLLGKELPANKKVFTTPLTSVSTDANGEKKFESLNPGDYTLSSIGSVSGYTLIGMGATYPVSLAPNESKNINFNFAKNNLDSSVVKVLKSSDGTPINNAQVRLKNSSGYDSSKTTASDGVAFFPEKSTPQIPLLPGTYDLEVKAAGFTDNNSSIIINAGDGLKQKTINLSVP